MQNKYEGRTYEEALQKCLRALELDETELYIDVKELEPSEDNKNKIEITVLPKSEVIEYIKEMLTFHMNLPQFIKKYHLKLI